jgi:hypothetical protein
LHERGASFGIAKDQKLGGPQRQPNLFGPGSVIDARKYGHALCFYGGPEPAHSILRPEAAL